MHYSIYPVYSLRQSNGALPIFFNVIPGRIDNHIATSFHLTELHDTSQKSLILDTGNHINSLETIQYWKSDKVNGGWEIFTPGAWNRPRVENFTITKIDTINRFVSGVFNFTLYVKNSNNEAIDSVVVTDGRFDLPFAEEACACAPN
jgi:hypothetical protein